MIGKIEIARINSSRDYTNNKSISSPISFNASKDDEEAKKGFSIKKATNVLGVVAWIAVAAMGIYKTGMFRKKSPEYIARKSAVASKGLDNLKATCGINETEQVSKAIAGKSALEQKKIKFLYGTGNWFQNQKDKLGSELFNNFTYAFGTLFVMPLVIWTSPFGKKDSSTSDKFYATIRQPFSVLATFTLQGMFDKMIDKYVPNAIKKNVLEDKSILKDGKIKLSEFDNIKYNSEEAKGLFRKLVDVSPAQKGLRGIINKDQAEMILKKGQFEEEKGQLYIKNLNKLLENLKLNAKEKTLLTDKVKVISNSVDLNNLAKQKPKIAMNVLVSAAIGCTFLNVIYGKSMKAIREKSEAKNQQKEVK